MRSVAGDAAETGGATVWNAGYGSFRQSLVDRRPANDKYGGSVVAGTAAHLGRRWRRGSYFLTGLLLGLGVWLFCLDWGLWNDWEIGVLVFAGGCGTILRFVRVLASLMGGCSIGEITEICELMCCDGTVMRLDVTAIRIHFLHS
ncbi:hypothetical protein SLA2020_367020 [Shorea laevis]